MGMDLVGNRPKNEKGNGFHLNWTGWRHLGDLLEALECDLSELSGSNDGDRIKASTCKQFAKAIRQALKENRIKTVFVVDAQYYGGGYHNWSVDNAEAKGLREEDRDLLTEIVDFFENCGGCKQF